MRCRGYIFNKDRDTVKAVPGVTCYDCAHDLNFKFSRERARTRGTRADANVNACNAASESVSRESELIYLRVNGSQAGRFACFSFFVAWPDTRRRRIFQVTCQQTFTRVVT